MNNDLETLNNEEKLGASPPNRKQIQGLALLLTKCNLTQTVQTLLKETNAESLELPQCSDIELQVILKEYFCKEDTTKETQCQTTDEVIRRTEALKAQQQEFMNLYNFVDQSLDKHKHELGKLLLPILTHIFYMHFTEPQRELAQEFLREYITDIGYFPSRKLQKLMLLQQNEQFERRQGQTTIRMSEEVHALFKYFLESHALIMKIISEHIKINIYAGVPTLHHRLHAQLLHPDNLEHIYLGRNSYTLRKPEDENICQEADDCDDAVEKGRKKRGRRPNIQLFPKRRYKCNPNAPPADRVPLPEPKPIDKLKCLKGTYQTQKRIVLSKHNLPSICCYSILNSNRSVTCTEISDDASMLACGFSNSYIRIWSLTPSKLHQLKNIAELNELDLDTPDIWAQMLDEKSGKAMINLYGHKGAVYRVNFSPDHNMVLSCSEDGTIRLWSLLTWTCIVVYKGHSLPVWDVCFSPLGYYFASCSYDKTARLWATDNTKSLRIFVGHIADVDCVQIHPNCNYVASGSTDCSVRLWDVTDGHCVRTMNGHGQPVQNIIFSNCGRLLTSASIDGTIIVWNLSNGHVAVSLLQHNSAVHSMCFSRDGNILATGGSDCCLALWDFAKLTSDYIDKSGSHEDDEEVDKSKIGGKSSSGNRRVSSKKNNGDEHKNSNYLLAAYQSKSTPFYGMQFTRTNLLLAAGPYTPN